MRSAVKNGLRVADVAELVILSDRVEARQRVPDSGCARALILVGAEHLRGLAVWLGTLLDVVPPTDVVVVEEVGRWVSTRSPAGCC